MLKGDPLTGVSEPSALSFSELSDVGESFAVNSYVADAVETTVNARAKQIATTIARTLLCSAKLGIGGKSLEVKGTSVGQGADGRPPSKNR